MKLPRLFLSAVVVAGLRGACGGEEFLVVAPDQGKGNGKHIVLLAGDEEYRSEEAMPMLGRLLAKRHGFKCTVLFSINPEDATISPLSVTNLPGLEVLANADLCILALRFRELPDPQMQHFVQYLKAGKPLIGLRTSTHAFAYSKGSKSAYVGYDWKSTEWPGGFGQQVLGETWVNHHGNHGKESTRGVINPVFTDHPVLRGVGDIWGPSDVYTVTHLGPDATVLLHGQVLSGMDENSPPVTGPKNEPIMPLAWLRDYKTSGGTTGRVLTTTMGAAVDLKNEGLRRLLVNGCYWLTGLGDKIPEKADVRFVGSYEPSYFGFGKFKPGVKPLDLKSP